MPYTVNITADFPVDGRIKDYLILLRVQGHYQDTKMAARPDAATWCSSSFEEYFYVFFSCTLVAAYVQYSTIISARTVTTGTTNPSEIRCSSPAHHPPTKMVQVTVAQKAEEGPGGLQAKLKANPHKPAIPNLFLANNKMDGL